MFARPFLYKTPILQAFRVIMAAMAPRCKILGYKLCARCREVKPLLEIVHTKGKPTNYCHPCASARQKEWRERNIEKVRARMREQHRAKKDIYLSKTKEWRAENKEHLKAYNKQYKTKLTAENPNYHKERYQKTDGKGRAAIWRSKPENAQKVADVQSRRRAIKLATAVEDIERSVVMRRDRGICYLCGRDLSQTPSLVHIEHVVPLSRGGTHTYDNVAVSCSDCNLSKGSKLPGECLWAKQRLALVQIV